MKKMKIHKNILLLLIVVLFAGCTGSYEEINDNPNSPKDVPPKFVLTAIMNRTMLVTTNYQNIQLLNADNYAQFYANDLGATYNSYNQVNQGIASLWSDITYYYLNMLNMIIDDHSDVLYQTNVVQMARIWKCWLMLRATDYWGDMPYFKVGVKFGEPAPYDKQQDIYDDMFKILADAVTKFDDDQHDPGAQDLLFGGKNNSWKKFANSLRLRMAMRISHVDPARAKTEAEAAIAGGLISSASETAALKCDESSASANHPIANVFSQGGFGMSLTMYNILTGLGGQAWPSDIDAAEKPATVDPRGPIMFDPSAGTATSTPTYSKRWTGTTPGLASQSGPTTTNNNARIGKFVNGNKSRSFNILTYSEVCFLLAEAKVRFPSWNTGAGTAQSWYEEGITASMATWGITNTTTLTNYLASTDPNVNGTTVLYTNTSGSYNTELDKIITQKWIALFPEGGWEAWADHRRLQKPRFIPLQNVNSQWFPVTGGYNPALDVPQNYIRRAAYPTSEQTLNKANLDAALSSLGGTYIGYITKPMWWDPYAEDGTLKPGATP